MTDSMTLSRMRGYIISPMGKDLKKAMQDLE
jgi:hypothetical protein